MSAPYSRYRLYYKQVGGWITNVTLYDANGQPITSVSTPTTTSSSTNWIPYVEFNLPADVEALFVNVTFSKPNPNPVHLFRLLPNSYGYYNQLRNVIDESECHQGDPYPVLQDGMIPAPPIEEYGQWFIASDNSGVRTWIKTPPAPPPTPPDLTDENGNPLTPPGTPPAMNAASPVTPAPPSPCSTPKSPSTKSATSSTTASARTTTATPCRSSRLPAKARSFP